MQYCNEVHYVKLGEGGGNAPPPPPPPRFLRLCKVILQQDIMSLQVQPWEIQQHFLESDI